MTRYRIRVKTLQNGNKEYVPEIEVKTVSVYPIGWVFAQVINNKWNELHRLCFTYPPIGVVYGTEDWALWVIAEHKGRHIVKDDEFIEIK